MDASEGKHILVINDTPAILDLFQEILSDEGYRVTIDNFARETGTLMAHIRDLQPDLLVLDFMVGGETEGWRLLQLLKMDRRTKDIPIIICTAAVRQITELREHLIEMGVGVVLKPFDIDRVLAGITAMLERGEPPMVPVPGQ